MNDIIREIANYIAQINLLELAGLIFGLLAVYYLIKENILTWPTGIIYVLISFVIFYQQKLYADLLLHVVFLVLNIYGWYFWVYGKKEDEKELPVTRTSTYILILVTIASLFGIALMGWSFQTFSDASLPYWDSLTTMLSFTGMWLTARKKIESWVFWFIVDVVATGVYMYKGIYFYAVLYCVYIGMAISGYRSWKKSMNQVNKVTTSSYD